MKDTAEPAADASLDLPVVLRNIVAQLQQEPQRYRLFGVYWWPVKAVLRHAGYGPRDLYMLGRYADPETAALVPRAGLRETMRAALAEYGFNARYPRAGGMVEAPGGGEVVRLYDQDAGA